MTMLRLRGGSFGSLRNPASMRCATCSAIPLSESISTTANSSPPYRTARSVERQCSIMTAASRFNARFPAGMTLEIVDTFQPIEVQQGKKR